MGAILLIIMCIFSLICYLYMVFTGILKHEELYREPKLSDVIYSAGLFCTMILHGLLILQALK